jgi:hypothetical protein
LLSALALLGAASPAHAYIDPGTGSALLYVVSGIVVSVYFSARSLYYRLLDVVFRMRFRDNRCSIALHCEDPRYEMIFLPLASALVARGIEPTLFTMYERDASYEPLPNGVAHRAIPSGMLGYAYLNNLEARVLATTTPQLDVMTFRRSRRIGHYAHVPHALGESRYVRPYAYDFFDSVLCCGPILAANIRRMESLRSLPSKELLETGVPHYDILLRQRGERRPPPGDPVVLVAPSWGPHSMFTQFGTSFVADLARHYRVIVRPHPQMRVSQADLYAEITSLDGVTVDTSRTPGAAMEAAHVLVSDISGIAHEFAFVHERPVIVLDSKIDVGGLEGEVLGGDSELKAACRDFIKPVPPSEIRELAKHVRVALDDDASSRRRAVRDEVIYNFGHATEVAADQLAALYERQGAAASSAPARMALARLSRLVRSGSH